MPLDITNFEGERQKAIVFKYKGWLVAMVLTYISMILARPIEFLCVEGFSKANLNFLIDSYAPKIMKTFGLYIFQSYFYWGESLFKRFTLCALIPVLPFFTYYITMLIVDEKNPYSFLAFTKGSGHKAREFEIKEMGLFDGFIFVLGKFKGKYLKLGETFSVLASAPPGTGKTTAIVVPTILECDGVSMIVNDPKPEICDQTSAYRTTIGPSFIINWAGRDDPENGLYWPSWNPLSPSAIPPPGPDRDMYIESMVSVFIQEPKSSSSDPHWTKTARAALTGLVHFIVNKCEKARANDYFKKKMESDTFDQEDAHLLESYYMSMNDPTAAGALNMLRKGSLNSSNYVDVGTWDNLPKEWVGHEACMPMILDWMTEAQISLVEDTNKRKQQGDQLAGFSDTIKELFQSAVREIRKYGYSYRALQELNKLSNTPDKERGSTLSTMEAGISIFKNTAVRQRTKTSDFTFKDLRGMIDPNDGKIKPVTVYLSVNLVDAQALAPLSGVFIELMSRELLYRTPDSIVHGEKTGPYPVLFVLDEFPQMPKLEAVISGPAVGRGQKVSYLLIAQDLNQIVAGYGQEAVETLFSTTYAKIILTQANERSAQRFSDLAASKGTDLSVNVKEGDAGAIFNRKTSKTIDSNTVVSKGGLLNLKKGKQYILIQGKHKTPIYADSPSWFEDDNMKKKVAMGKSSPVPLWLLDKKKK